jgi:hypothetical protein
MKMRRKTFDLVLTLGGAVVTVFFVAAGVLLLWGYSFANTHVHNQLAQQEIFFPTKAQLDHPDGKEITAGMRPYLLPYAGQQVLTGAQAEAYADHFIGVHLSEMPYGGVYSKVSAASQAHPTNTALAAEANTIFKGTTLRGLLLEAYSFWTFGQIALVASIISFCLAGVMLVLSVLGFVHWRRVSADIEFPREHHQPVEERMSKAA